MRRTVKGQEIAVDTRAAEAAEAVSSAPEHDWSIRNWESLDWPRASLCELRLRIGSDVRLLPHLWYETLRRYYAREQRRTVTVLFCDLTGSTAAFQFDGDLTLAAEHLTGFLRVVSR